MRQTRIYQPGQYQQGDTLELNESPAHHLATVLRARVGEELFLFNGKQKEFKAKITAIQKKRVQVLVGEAIDNQRESPLQIHLAQAICKGDKMDWVLQKATELGVQIFTPILSSRAASDLSDDKRREKKMKHWEGVIIHATEQSGRNQLPVLHTPKTLEQFLPTIVSGSKWIMTPGSSETLRTTKIIDQQITVMVGPEGGWSDSELLNAQSQGFLPLSLGPRILRTESAPIAIISVLQYMAGDF